MMAETHLTTPLLLYIDDHQGGDTAKLVAFAQHLGVKVRTFKTTEDFEVWAALNMGTIPSSSCPEETAYVHRFPTETQYRRPS